MAQRTVVQLTDDLDGTEIRDGKGETLSFALDRQGYEIDLTDKNAKAMREAFQKYISAARRASGGAGTRASGRGRRAASGSSGPARDYDPKAVREWASSQGIEVSQRGRVSADLVAKFQAANA